MAADLASTVDDMESLPSLPALLFKKVLLRVSEVFQTENIFFFIYSGRSFLNFLFIFPSCKIEHKRREENYYLIIL